MSDAAHANIRRRASLTLTAPALLAAASPGAARGQSPRRLAYLTPGLDLPFWRFVLKGVTDEVKSGGMTVTAYDSDNSAQTQLQNTQRGVPRRGRHRALAG